MYSLAETERPGPKERLSDEEMGNLLSALGNHEAKAVTFLVMKPGIVYSQGDLHRAVMQAQGEKKGWRVSHSGPFRYCEQSLAPIGRVTKEVLNPDLSTYGYLKTEYGEKVGVPLAGLLLWFSLKYPECSLIDLLGSTVSSGKIQEITLSSQENREFKKRASLTRLKIFRELAFYPSLPLREVDLVTKIGESQGYLESHLENLQRLGIILYESVGAGESGSLLRISSQALDKEPPAFRGYPTLTRRVFQILKENPSWFTLEQLIEDYQQRFIPETGREKVKKKSLKKRIPSVTAHLTREGYVEIGKFHEDKRSEINLTEKQRVILLDLVILLEGFQNQNPEVLGKGRECASSLLSSPKEIAALMKKAKEHSSFAQRTSPEETGALVLSLISSHPDITASQIRKRMEEKYKKRLRVGRIREILQFLTIKKAIVFSQKGNLRRFHRHS